MRRAEGNSVEKGKGTKTERRKRKKLERQRKKQKERERPRQEKEMENKNNRDPGRRGEGRREQGLRLAETEVGTLRRQRGARGWAAGQRKDRGRGSSGHLPAALLPAPGPALRARAPLRISAPHGQQ